MRLDTKSEFRNFDSLYLIPSTFNSAIFAFDSTSLINRANGVIYINANTLDGVLLRSNSSCNNHGKIISYARSIGIECRSKSIFQS